MERLTNEQEIKSPAGRLFWASCELEKSIIRLSAMGTSLDALLAVMHERIPSDENIENLRIWLNDLFDTERGILQAVNEEVGNVGRNLSNETKTA